LRSGGYVLKNSGKNFGKRGVFISMNLRETIKKILREELNTDSTNTQRQVKLIKKLLDSSSYEGVCGYIFTIDEDNDRVASVILKFSEEWYWSSVEFQVMNRKLSLIGRTKIEIGEIINRYLNIELYVGSYLDKCD
jgi:hypothetical protein